MSDPRPSWMEHATPLDLRMPDDGTLPPLSGPYPQTHEDSQDCVGSDGVYGPRDENGQLIVDGPGGSGMYFGYARRDAANIVLLDQAVRRRPPVAGGVLGFNLEHALRGFRPAGIRADMTGSPADLRAFCLVEDEVRARTSEQGQVDYGHGFTPGTLAQWHDVATHAPHVGLPGEDTFGYLNASGFNLRGHAMLGYLHAWRLKFGPLPGSTYATAWLEICALAAIPGTGQLVVEQRDGVDQPGVCMTLHQGFAVHAALALCFRTRRHAPQWVLDWMLGLLDQPAYSNYGADSPAAYLRSVDGHLVAATGSDQHGDPAFGHWSANCVALWRVTGDHVWLDRAAKWGPTTAVDEQARKDSLLLRGALGG